MLRRKSYLAVSPALSGVTSAGESEGFPNTERLAHPRLRGYSAASVDDITRSHADFSKQRLVALDGYIDSVARLTGTRGSLGITSEYLGWADCQSAAG
jgi:hypothetical protein